MCALKTIDTILFNMELLASPNWTSKIRYEAVIVASLLAVQSFCAALINLFTIAAKYKEPLEAAHVHIDDIRYDMVECCCWLSQIGMGPLRSASMTNHCVYFRNLSYKC